MSSKILKGLLGLIFLALLSGGLWFYYFTQAKGDSSRESTQKVGICQKHRIQKKDCPFCNKSLIKEKGFCKGHGVPEALCTRCSPFLIPAFKIEKDWCSGHKVPESQCETCNPGVLDQYKEKGPGPKEEGDLLCRHELLTGECPFCDKNLIEKKGFCKGHGVPEALCTRCTPDLIPAFKAEKDWCEGHKIPESQCEACNPGILAKYKNWQRKAPLASRTVQLLPISEVPRSKRAPSVTCKTHQVKIQFRSPEIAQNAGFVFQKIARRPITEFLDCNGRISYNYGRYARLSSRVSGIVVAVKKDLGDEVKEGDVLAVLDCVDLGGAKAACLQARALKDLYTRAFEREYEL